MSRGNEFSDDGIERVTAVAAAAFAIHSVEESEITRPRKKVDRPETSSFPNTKNVKEDNRALPLKPAPAADKIFQPFSDVAKDAEEASDKKVAVNSEQQKQRPIEKITDPSPGGGRIEPERPVAVPGSPTPPTSQARPSETKAHLWEKAEMAKIKERYKKVNETISYWESKKKDKAMRKFEASQAEGVKRSKKVKGRRRLEEDMELIKKIAGEARAKADRKKKNEILKANQKADIIRQTGDLPLTGCCC